MARQPSGLSHRKNPAAPLHRPDLLSCAPSQSVAAINGRLPSSPLLRFRRSTLPPPLSSLWLPWDRGAPTTTSTCQQPPDPVGVRAAAALHPSRCRCRCRSPAAASQAGRQASSSVALLSLARVPVAGCCGGEVTVRSAVRCHRCPPADTTRLTSRTCRAAHSKCGVFPASLCTADRIESILRDCAHRSR